MAGGYSLCQSFFYDQTGRSRPRRCLWDKTLSTIDGAVFNKFFQPGLLPAAQTAELHAELSYEVGYFCAGDGIKFGALEIKTDFRLENVQDIGLTQELQVMDIPK